MTPSEAFARMLLTKAKADLAALSDLVCEISLEQPVVAKDIGYLTPWAVELRYDMPSDQRLDRSRVLAAATSAVNWAGTQITD